MLGLKSFLTAKSITSGIKAMYILKKEQQIGILKVALGMIQKGIDSETISELTGLSLDEINNLHHQ